MVEACCTESALEKGVFEKGLGAAASLSVGLRGLLLDLRTRPHLRHAHIPSTAWLRLAYAQAADSLMCLKCHIPSPANPRPLRVYATLYHNDNSAQVSGETPVIFDHR